MGLFTSAKAEPKFKKLKEEGCVVTLSVEIPAQEVQDQTQTSLVRVQSRAQIPGFRQGKAPLAVVQQHFSGHAREEAVDQLIRKHVPAALEQFKLRAVDSPSIEDMKWKDGEPLVLQVRVEVAPVPTAKDYAKIPVARQSQAADAKALDKRLEDLRESHARLEAAKDEALGDAHFAVIDYAASRDGKPLTNSKGTAELVDMSAEQSVEGLIPGLKGMKRGSRRRSRSSSTARTPISPSRSPRSRPRSFPPSTPSSRRTSASRRSTSSRRSSRKSSTARPSSSPRPTWCARSRRRS